MTHRIFTADTLVVATHNKGKVPEIAGLLGGRVAKLVSAGELGLPEPEETADSFAGNALLKARAAAEVSRLPALADDSGLCVTALNDDPGIYSARWAGESRDFGVAMRRVHEGIGASSDRSARFVCALALCWPDGHAEVFEGDVKGNLIWPPRGGTGFGYDPIFVPAGYDVTFSEMHGEEKQKISHRAAVFAKLLRACFP